jgi:hypothetical protein
VKHTHSRPISHTTTLIKTIAERVTVHLSSTFGAAHTDLGQEPFAREWIVAVLSCVVWVVTAR